MGFQVLGMLTAWGKAFWERVKVGRASVSFTTNKFSSQDTTITGIFEKRNTTIRFLSNRLDMSKEGIYDREQPGRATKSFGKESMKIRDQ